MRPTSEDEAEHGRGVSGRNWRGLGRRLPRGVFQDRWYWLAFWLFAGPIRERTGRHIAIVPQIGREVRAPPRGGLSGGRVFRWEAARRFWPLLEARHYRLRRISTICEAGVPTIGVPKIFRRESILRSESRFINENRPTFGEPGVDALHKLGCG